MRKWDDFKRDEDFTKDITKSKVIDVDEMRKSQEMKDSRKNNMTIDKRDRYDFDGNANSNKSTPKKADKETIEEKRKLL